ncbi:MAG TPA: DUF4190 domain-containing protein [Planctomycetota bacterium]|nr:DUF4190 domain-containing protein [Planctomycetota bacterium]
MPVAALILGILAILVPGLGIIFAIVAIILGIVVLTRRREEPGPARGHGKAIAGIVTGGIGLLLVPVHAGLLIPALMFARTSANATASGNNLRSITTACSLYQADHGGPERLWPTDLAVLQRELDLPVTLFQAKDGSAVPPPHYLYVRPAPNAPADQLVLIENPAIRPRRVMAAFVDGHVRRVPRGEVEALWDEAQRLARSPEAAAEGVPASAWTGIPEP